MYGGRHLDFVTSQCSHTIKLGGVFWGTENDKCFPVLKTEVNLLGKTKELAYKALVRPIVGYACCVWDPHTTGNTNKLEKIQRRAARFVLNRHRNTSSVSDMLDQLQWVPLQDRRRSIRLTMLYKIKHGLACVRCDALKPLTDSNRRRRRVHSQQYQHFNSRTDYRLYSFFPRTVRDWNTLPEATVQSSSLATFVSKVSSSA
ncbi:Hypp7506 [Branchiostoma lanceolatum]|uniref:Hypp7506 protein n=1 Tax=Branchiostoma lanceolatum TaxID=7740 RepID=A0A8J9Z1N7_BRALA|nr:Hypp7506 [Branchiostoma lanceolatum]